MAELGYVRYNYTTIPDCTCILCSLARASLANNQPTDANHLPTDKELADAVRKSVQAMASAVWAARNRGITVDFNVQTEGSYWPVRAIPGTFVLRSIYRETTETVPASTKTVRVNL